MVEYNFWDDRTLDDNDENFCPVINGSCPTQDCENCAERIEFEKYVDERMGDNADKS